MTKKIMICGVDCTRSNGLCNGYCTGESDNPPAATDEQILASAKEAAHKALNEAEAAWYKYFGLCEVGPERTTAASIYERLRHARRGPF